MITQDIPSTLDTVILASKGFTLFGFLGELAISSLATLVFLYYNIYKSCVKLTKLFSLELATLSSNMAKKC